MYTPIRDYAIIGNLHSSVLISKAGSIDWACSPFLYSPSIFGGLLDKHRGGHWCITPNEFIFSSQEYIPHTNILVTSFVTSSGRVEIVDFVPIEKFEEQTSYDPRVFKIYRKVRCTEGTVEMYSHFQPQFDYGRAETQVENMEYGLRATSPQEIATLFTKVPFTLSDSGAQANITLKEGEEAYFLFRYGSSSEQLFNLKEVYRQAYERTYRYWIEWIKKCNWELCRIEEGPLREMVIRSLLVLKTLVFEPTGSIAAAATTSLPEEIGGVRNWDYRFMWLRDASFTVQAFLRVGLVDEAENFLRWLLEDVCRDLKGIGVDNLQIMYGLMGEGDLREEFLTHLEGYEKSQPVRIGNGAFDQKQWDIYGSVLDTVWQLKQLKRDYMLSESMWHVLRMIANYILHIWNEPDEGLWEVRGGREHFVYSKFMCYVALDRAAKLAREFHFEGEVEEWLREADKIKKEILEKGWNEEKQTFTQSFDSDKLDSALLLMPVVGFIEGTDAKMVSTIDRIVEELCENGFLYRYKTRDGLPGEEGVFLLANFWLIDAYTLSHQREKAQNMFEKMIGCANHVGLYAEEMDPKTKAFLGNFPQAYTHIGLVNSAYLLQRLED